MAGVEHKTTPPWYGKAVRGKGGQTPWYGKAVRGKGGQAPWYGKAVRGKGGQAPCVLWKLGMVVWSYRHACTQHNLTVLTVTSCNIEYLLRYSRAPVASVHYQHCELLSNVCMSEREGSAGQQW